MALTCSDIFKFIFAVIFPPLGVLLEVGCTMDLLINIALTILGYIPGRHSFTMTYSFLLNISNLSFLFCCRYCPRFLYHTSILMYHIKSYHVMWRWLVI